MHCLAVAGGPNEMQVALRADLVMLPDFDATHNQNHTDNQITEQEPTESDDESTSIDEQAVANSSEDDNDHTDSEDGTNEETNRSEGIETENYNWEQSYKGGDLSDEEVAIVDDEQEASTLSYIQNDQLLQFLDEDHYDFNEVCYYGLAF